MATLAIWGEVTQGAIFTKCGVWVDMVDIITYAIFGDCRLWGVGVMKGVTLPSPIDLNCRPYNTGHTRDRVILNTFIRQRSRLRIITLGTALMLEDHYSDRSEITDKTLLDTIQK